MCTVSWIARDDGYDLLCNRDERRERAQAVPPMLWPAAEGSYLAPRDPEGGGSWLSVNEHGLTLCLLNHYAAENRSGPPRGEITSRGRIVTTLADRRSIAATRACMQRLELARFRPFMLLALAPGHEPALWLWDGNSLQEEVLARPPLTTSSRDDGRVCHARRQSFRALTAEGPDAPPPSLDQLYTWHRTGRPDAPHAGVAMHRDDAATVSLSHVRVGPAGIEMHYFAGHPATTRNQAPVTRRLPGVQRARLPGDRPPRDVAPATFDVQALFEDKNPALARRVPAPAHALLRRLAHQDEINRGLYAIRDTPCRQFPARVLEYLGVTCQLAGPRPPGPEQRPILAANHPLGAIDGLAMLAWMLSLYPDVRAPVNDVLARVPHLQPFITPIDKYRRQRETSRQLHETFASDAAVLVFPAGATSRYRHGRLCDGPWEKMPVRMAREHDRPILPVYIDGRLSRRFYTVARLRRLCGIRLNLEMLLLVDEMFRPATPRLGITLGRRITPPELENLGTTDRERAAALRAACYGLEAPAERTESLEVTTA